MKINLNKTIIGLGICTLATVAMAQNNYSQNDTGNGAVTPQHFVWEAATTDMKEIHMGEVALQKTDNADVKKFAKRLIADHQKSSKKLQAIAEKDGLNFPDTNSFAMDRHDRWQTNNWNSNSNAASGLNAAGIDTNNPATMSSAGGHQNYKGAEIMELGGQTITNADGTVTPLPEREMNWDALSGVEFDRAFAAHMVKGHAKAISKFEMASAGLPDGDLKKFADKTLPVLRTHLEMAQELQAKVGMWSENGQNAAYMNHNQ